MPAREAHGGACKLLFSHPLVVRELLEGAALRRMISGQEVPRTQTLGLKPFTAPDLRANYHEDRYLTIGSLDGRMVVMVWTPRGEARRIISLRKAQ